MSSVSVYKDSNCELFLEQAEGELFIHCDIHRWRKGLIPEFDLIFAHLISSLKDKNVEAINAAILPEDNKLKKFAEMFGFDSTDNVVIDSNNRTREVYTCSI